MNAFYHAIKSTVAAALVALCASGARAQLFITEAHSTGSASLAYGADWFELTNTGASPISLTGWRIDDNSAAFASGSLFRGVSSIAPGQSIVFFEANTAGTNDATIAANLSAEWGGGLTYGVNLGSYGGSGLGLGSGGDAINIFNADGVLQANISFGLATNGTTFDNSARLNNATVSTLSAVGVNGAFLSTGGEIGSPGIFVPEPSALGLLALGLAPLGALIRRRR